MSSLIFLKLGVGLLLEQTEYRNSNVSLSLTAQLALMMFNQAMGFEAFTRHQT